MRKRLRFLMELVLDYNETHEETRAIIRVDYNSVDVFVEDRKGKDKMIDIRYFGDLTEEAVYEIYKEMNAVTEQSTASDDAPQNMNVTEE